jgi:hypothetical protein
MQGQSTYEWCLVVQDVKGIGRDTVRTYTVVWITVSQQNRHIAAWPPILASKRIYVYAWLR